MLWCLLGGSALALLIAAINHKNSSLCSGLAVEINEGGKANFLDKGMVTEILLDGGIKDLRDKKMASVNIQKLENLLRKNPWIQDVQLYFDNNQILKVRIQERQPIARLFTVSGMSFLIDSSGMQLPLAAHSVFNLPVFTGYPDQKFGLHKDSALNQQIRNLSVFLSRDPFWSNQIQEVHIISDQTFQMTPLIGNQVIEFGDGSDYENKFHHLFVFYRKVLTQIGFEKYTSIKLAYSGEIIATRKQGFISKTDSIQAHRNVMEMIRLAQKMESDTGKIREIKPLERNTETEQNLKSYDLPEEKENTAELNSKHQKQQ